MCFYPFPTWLRRIGKLALVPLLAACASTTAPDKLISAEARIYRVSETEALALTRQALRTVFPDTDITSFDGEYSGYFTFVQLPTDADPRYARFVAKTVTYMVEVVPVQGRDAQGRPVDGYLYRLKGAGEGEAQGKVLQARLAELFDATGRGVPATQLGAVHMTKAQREREAQAPREAKVSEPPRKAAAEPGADVYESLRQLKRLHDEGVLSDEEYQKSKSRLLERL